MVVLHTLHLAVWIITPEILIQIVCTTRCFLQLELFINSQEIIWNFLYRKYQRQECFFEIKDSFSLRNLFLKLHAECLAMMPWHYCHLICLNWWVKWGFFIDISTCVFLCLFMWSRWNNVLITTLVVKGISNIISNGTFV